MSEATSAPKRIGVLVVAYNAASSLHKVLDRIPESFRSRVEHVLVCDDASHDATYLIGLGYQATSDLPLTVIRHESNLGYGGNQKAGYRWAIDHGLDIIVMLHGDGQYAPEVLDEVVAPLEREECDCVLGSRMMTPGTARKGGMPRYKYVGNRILSRFQNAVTGLSLSEWHSGYRAYSVPALAELPFEANSDDFDFDTEIILELLEAGKTIKEIPIPTFYGDEICNVNGVRYAYNVVDDVVRYRLHKMGFGSGERAFNTEPYPYKNDPGSSHRRLLDWVVRNHPTPVRILDLGSGAGPVAGELTRLGHSVVGVDGLKPPGAGERFAEFIEADLEYGIPHEAGAGFDVILAADILEHLRHPEDLLVDARTRLAPGGRMLVSVPNFAHWYPRARVALGRFDYDRQGILDRTHLRFFTRASFERLVTANGFRVRRRDYTGLPIDVLDRGERTSGGAMRAVRAVDQTGVGVWPSLFAYQLLYELVPAGD